MTLTFNLLAGTDTPTSEPGPGSELAHCLTEHFTTPATRRYGGRELDPPNRLVFLLDHEYTQRGLSWRRLKGADAERAALLRTAAERAGCEAVLALAEVKPRPTHQMQTRTAHHIVVSTHQDHSAACTGCDLVASNTSRRAQGRSAPYV